MSILPMEEKPLKAKVLSLIEKTRNRLNQLDQKKFPSHTTEDARRLVVGILDTLSESRSFEPPILFYRVLLDMQSFVDNIESSTIDHISWPIVSYCDEIWKSIFKTNDQKIFYSLTRDHNYYLSPFSDRLKNVLSVSSVISSSQINEIFSGKYIYCLNLASLEKDNLPLYALIGHEFGHAVFRYNNEDIIKKWNRHSTDLINRLEMDGFPDGIIDIIKAIIHSYSVEIFSDLIGTLMTGPAFLLAFNELTWGKAKSSWSIRFPLSGNTPYPSHDFRLELIKSHIDIDKIINKMKDISPSKDSGPIEHSINIINKYIESIPSSEEDIINVGPASFSDREIIKKIITDNLKEIKRILQSFIADSKTEFNLIYQPIDGRNVAELLRRFIHRILPNIVPDSTLLGKPAEFQDILNACTIHRYIFLHTVTVDSGSQSINKEIQMIERLTEKSLEVSFVQKKYKKGREL